MRVLRLFFIGLTSVSFFFQTAKDARFTLMKVSALRHSFLHSSDFTLSPSDGDEAAAGKPPEDREAWLCRISKDYGACGEREYYDLGDPPRLHMYCPDDLCCSKTACVGSCGSWCSGSWALCSSSVVYHTEYSYGNCNCKRFGGKCDRQAECVHINKEEGGVFCRCKQGYWGDGKTCKLDLCALNPCTPGTCERTEDNYHCQCPKTHKLVTTEGRERCQEKTNYCSAKPCGPESMVRECTNTDDGYECTCKQGYEVRNNRCEEIDLCASSPCGPPEAVHSCVTQRQPKLLHRCLCRAGYTLHILPDGETETCAKDWCYGEPCGPPDRVSSCSSKITGYSCLCKEGYMPSTNSNGEETCVREDVCKQAPCGPPNAVKQCYLEGSSYRCLCEAGYAEAFTNGTPRCLFGDPCKLGACGAPAAVMECSTDGSSYSCTCNPGFTEVLKDGQRTCVSEQECAAHCGTTESVKLCELIEGGEVKCSCNPGYVLKYRAGVGKCEQGDSCTVSPCGKQEAVRSCLPAGPSYTCECNEGYTRRILKDGNQVCADASSCAGHPCGPPEVAEACLSTEDGYTCKCKEGFTQQLVDGSPRCTFANSSSKRTRDGDNEAETEEGSGFSEKAIAGGVVGVLLFVGALGAAVTYRMRRRAIDGSDGADEGEDNVIVDRPFLAPATAVGAADPSCGWAASVPSSGPSASPQLPTW